MVKEKVKKNEAQVIISNSIIPVSVGDIEPSPFEFQEIRRQTYTEESLRSLGESIRSIQIEPAIVRWNPVTKKHQIISGERRWRAAQIVGIEKLDCVVRNLTDVQALEVQYKENHDRQDNDPLVDAFLFKHLLEKENFSIVEIRDKFNIKSNKEVWELILLNDLIDEGKIQLTKKILPKRHALKIASFLNKEVQKKIIEGNFAYRGLNIENRPVPFEQFEEIIEDNFGRKLATAPFDTEDERLHITALKCSNCTENSVNQPDLFGARFDGEAACLNAVCFGLKTSAFFRISREEAAAKMPNPENKPIEVLAKEVPVVATRPTTEKAYGENVIHTPIIEKPECKYSIPAVIGDGENRNKSAWTCNTEDCEIHFPKEKKPKLEDWQLKNYETKFNAEVLAVVRERIFKQSIEFFDDYKPFWMYNDLIGQLILSFWNTSGALQKDFIFSIISKWKGCPSNYKCHAFEVFIQSLKKPQQSRLLFLLSFKNEALFVDDDKSGLERIFREFADGNYQLLDAQIRYELAPPEFKAKAEDYLGHVQNGYEVEIPKFWTDTEIED